MRPIDRFGASPIPDKRWDEDSDALSREHRGDQRRAIGDGCFWVSRKKALS